MNLWQRTYAKQRQLPVSGAEAEAFKRANTFAVTRGARGGLHGWDTETVSCATRADADALMASALSLPRTIDVRIVDWSASWVGGKPVDVSFKRRPRQA